MKTFFLTMAFFVIALAHCGGQDDLIARVRDAAKHEGDAYIEARDKIVSLGESVLPLLAEAATDEAMSWQERLAARICFERIARGDVIQALREHDWRQYPNYQGGPVHILGPHVGMGQYVKPLMHKTGLWHTYLEAVWKNTSEVSVPSFDPRFDQSWEGWAKAVVWEESEKYYLMKHIIQRLDNKRGKALHSILSDGVISTNPSDLVMALEDFAKKSGNARYDEVSDVLLTVISLVDVSYHRPLELFLQRFPGRTRFVNRLEEAKTRSTPVELKDPPFRLGTEPVDTVLERIATNWKPAFRQDVPIGFVPTPANAILDLRTPERLVWRVDGPLQKSLTRETRFFVQTREAARPDAWCSVVARHQGVRAVGLGEGALLVAHRTYGQNDSKPMPFGEQAATTVHRLEHFAADDGDKPALPTVFLGDTYGDSTVTDIAFEYPTKEEIEKLLHGKAREDSYRISFRVQATVDGSAQRKIAQGEVRGIVGDLRRYRGQIVEEYFLRRHPVLDMSRSGVSFWNGSDWETADWRPPAPPKPHPPTGDLEIDIQF